MKKRIIAFILLITILFPYASAGIFDWFKENIQFSPSAETDVRLEVGNVAPTITYISVIPNIDLNPSPQTTQVIFTFRAQDSNGINDLQDSSAAAALTRGAIVKTASCVFLSDNPPERTYQCTLTLDYYNEPGTWDLAVTIEDQAGLSDQEASTAQINLLRDISIAPAIVLFPTLVQSQANTLASANTIITNNGNAEIPATSNLEITAYNLLGETTPAENIPAGNFNAAPDSASDACDSVSGGATQLSSGIARIISGITLPRGPSGSNTEQVAYCLTLVPPAISSQFYSAAAGGQAWLIEIN